MLYSGSWPCANHNCVSLVVFPKVTSLPWIFTWSVSYNQRDLVRQLWLAPRCNSRSCEGKERGFAPWTQALFLTAPPPTSHTINVWDPALQYLPPDGPAGEKAMTADPSMVLCGCPRVIRMVKWPYMSDLFFFFPSCLYGFTSTSVLHIQKSGARLGPLLSVTPWQFSEARVSVERVQLNGSLRPLGPCVFHPRTVLREGLLHDLGIIILT